jgi:hypothetical protein
MRRSGSSSGGIGGAASCRRRVVCTDWCSNTLWIGGSEGAAEGRRPHKILKGVEGRKKDGCGWWNDLGNHFPHGLKVWGWTLGCTVTILWQRSFPQRGMIREKDDSKLTNVFST